jgi:hypothetical protein
MVNKRKVCQVFYNNPQGSRLSGRSKGGWWNCVQTVVNKCKIKNWKDMSRNRADWEKSIKEAKVCIGLLCHLRRRRRTTTTTTIRTRYSTTRAFNIEQSAI